MWENGVAERENTIIGTIITAAEGEKREVIVVGRYYISLYFFPFSVTLPFPLPFVHIRTIRTAGGEDKKVVEILGGGGRLLFFLFSFRGYVGVRAHWDANGRDPSPPPLCPARCLPR